MFCKNILSKIINMLLGKVTSAEPEGPVPKRLSTYCLVPLGKVQQAEPEGPVPKRLTTECSVQKILAEGLYLMG
jgi:hypothetical protein